jgi:lactoylglutathione lyase
MLQFYFSVSAGFAGCKVVLAHLPEIPIFIPYINIMSINLQGLRTVGYKVSDLDKAKEWYSNMLGIKPYFDEPFYVGFNVAGYELGLQPEDGAGISKSANVAAYWGVADVQAAYEWLLANGATPFEEPMDVGGDIKVATVFDPWGNAFGIIYNPHFKL